MCVRTAEQVFSPLDNQLGLNSSAYSPSLAKRMVWLSALLPFEQCQQVFDRLTDRLIPAKSIQRQTQYYGSKMESQQKFHQQMVSVERIVLPDAIHDHDERKIVSIDGGMVNIRGEGWRELKVGAVFDVEMRLEHNAQTKELDEMAHGVNLHYTAVLGSKDDFTPALWTLAVDNDVPTARDRAVIGDGALWIWNVAEDICPDGQQIVDWYHAAQHLSEASHLLYPDEDDNQNRLRWLKTYKDHLYMGRIRKIIAVLNKRGRDDLALYFERHQRRMQYLKFREEGFPIGSGTIESGVKQFKHRLAGTGMRWNIDNANRMLVLRAAVLGDDFDALWDAVA